MRLIERCYLNFIEKFEEYITNENFANFEYSFEFCELIYQKCLKNKCLSKWKILGKQKCYSLEFIDKTPERKWENFWIISNPNMTIEYLKKIDIFESEIFYKFIVENESLSLKELVKNFNIKLDTYNCRSDSLERFDQICSYSHIYHSIFLSSKMIKMHFSNKIIDEKYLKYIKLKKYLKVFGIEKTIKFLDRYKNYYLRYRNEYLFFPSQILNKLIENGVKFTGHYPSNLTMEIIDKNFTTFSHIFDENSDIDLVNFENIKLSWLVSRDEYSQSQKLLDKYFEFFATEEDLLLILNDKKYSKIISKLRYDIIIMNKNISLKFIKENFENNYISIFLKKKRITEDEYENYFENTNFDIKISQIYDMSEQFFLKLDLIDKLTIMYKILSKKRYDIIKYLTEDIFTIIEKLNQSHLQGYLNEFINYYLENNKCKISLKTLLKYKRFIVNIDNHYKPNSLQIYKYISLIHYLPLYPQLEDQRDVIIFDNILIYLTERNVENFYQNINSDKFKDKNNKHNLPTEICEMILIFLSNDY